MLPRTDGICLRVWPHASRTAPVFTNNAVTTQPQWFNDLAWQRCHCSILENRTMVDTTITVRIEGEFQKLYEVNLKKFHDLF